MENQTSDTPRSDAAWIESIDLSWSSAAHVMYTKCQELERDCNIARKVCADEMLRMQLLLNDAEHDIANLRHRLKQLGGLRDT